jgi:hypothetical protein
VITFKVSEYLDKRRPIASGAATGNDHAGLIKDAILKAGVSDSGLIVAVDFSGIELVTASYIKATVLWLAMCGRLHAGALTPAEQKTLDWASIEPLNVFPLVVGATEDVRNEIDEVFGRRGLPCVCVESRTKKAILEGKVLGNVDPAIARTIQSLRGQAETTAEDLHASSPAEGVNITAWSNRLAELLRLRIAQRKRQGKTWRYQPLAQTLIYG